MSLPSNSIPRAGKTSIKVQGAKVTLLLLPDIVQVCHHALHAVSPLQVVEPCYEKWLSQPMQPTSETHLQRERKKVCHKNQGHAIRLIALRCLQKGNYLSEIDKVCRANL